VRSFERPSLRREGVLYAALTRNQLFRCKHEANDGTDLTREKLFTRSVNFAPSKLPLFFDQARN
jgi:hypothetical protein